MKELFRYHQMGSFYDFQMISNNYISPQKFVPCYENKMGDFLQFSAIFQNANRRSRREKCQGMRYLAAGVGLKNTYHALLHMSIRKSIGLGFVSRLATLFRDEVRNADNRCVIGMLTVL